MTNEGSNVVTQTERKRGMLWWYFFGYMVTVDKNDLVNSALNSMWNVNHEFGKEYVDSDRIANVYFTGDKDAKERVRSLNDLDKNDLNTIRRSSENEDGMFNDCQCSDHEYDEIAWIDS